MLEQGRAPQDTNTYPKTALYRFVFGSLTTKWAVFLLFCFLLLQPLTPAFAFLDEESVPESTSSDVEYENVVETEAPTDIPEFQDVDSNPDDTQAAEEPLVIVEETLPEETVTSEVASSTDLTTSTPELPSPEPGEEEVDTGTTTQEEIVEPIEEIPQEVLETPHATTSTTTDVIQVAVAEHNSSEYQFDTTQCAAVGDGAYYCSNTKDAPSVVNDGVFSAPDQDGDLEIYVRLDGQENQLTTNNVDDSAPYYDALSQRIVWHTVIEDRYQIVSYDIESGDKTLLTKTTYNNMEPVAYEGVTLWQAWIDNNWEIMLYDGEKIQQLTNNTLQDVSPHMREGYIVWQTQFVDGWKVAVYDQETKAVEYIASESGLKVENPRFVLVYDSTDDNGDTQTLGYDLDSKKSFTLGSLPAELPEELPEPDQTGETRALIQNKQTSREGETEIIDVPQIGSNNSSSTPNLPTQDGTLDLSTGTTSATSSIPVVENITDLVIPDFTPTSTSSQDIADIPDLVIPPVLSTSTVEIS